VIKRKTFIVGVIVLVLLLGAGYVLAQAPLPTGSEPMSALADTFASADTSALAGGATGAGGDFLVSI
jgi:hypothetical protein